MRLTATLSVFMACAAISACDRPSQDGPLPEVRGALIVEPAVAPAAATDIAPSVEPAVASAPAPAPAPAQAQVVPQDVEATVAPAPDPVVSPSVEPALTAESTPAVPPDAEPAPVAGVAQAAAPSPTLAADPAPSVTRDEPLDRGPASDAGAEHPAAQEPGVALSVVTEAAELPEVETAAGAATAPPPPPAGAAPDTPRPFPFDEDDVAQPLSWDDLDVPDDHIPMPWPVDGVEPDPVRYPADLAALDGTLVAVEGFVIPTVDWGKELRRFAISVDPPGCCFGQASALDRWIEVELIDDADALEYSYWAVARVEGELIVAERRNPYGYIESMYQLRARRAVTVD